jgi:pyruvate dehydrogenase E2 component (dihydrolipoamide acetyltransferase)
MTEIYMPKAGMDMKEGVLVRWLKSIGDPVEKDEPIMEIETDKITMEAEAPASGFLLAIYSEEGDVIPVLGIMGYIGAKHEIPPTAPGKTDTAAPEAHVLSLAAAEANAPTVAASVDTADNVRATPGARQLAKELGVDISCVTPTGKHGEVLGEDVRKAAKQPVATPLAQRIADDSKIAVSSIQGTGFGGRVTKADVLLATAPAQAVSAVPAGEDEQLTIESRRPLNAMNRVVAERMSQSHYEIPGVTQSLLVDMTDLLALRAKINARREQKISVNDFVLKATAIAVKEQPLARTSIYGSEYVVYCEANIGFAVSVNDGDGLLVPVLHNADRMPFAELSAKAKELAARARENKLKPGEYAGGTYTVSNMGMYDVWDFTPIINQPQSGILGIGSISDILRFAPDGSVVSRKMCKLLITYDHRIMNGVTAAKFELRVRDLLENPEELLLT